MASVPSISTGLRRFKAKRLSKGVCTQRPRKGISLGACPFAVCALTNKALRPQTGASPGAAFDAMARGLGFVRYQTDAAQRGEEDQATYSGVPYA